MSRSKIRKLGTVAKEIINIEPKNISIRLQDGSYLGPRIVEAEITEEGKTKSRFVIHPNDQELKFNSETLTTMINQGWNYRGDFERVTELMKLIEASGKIEEPLDLILDGDRLYPFDGQHRLISVWRLKEEKNFEISKIPAIIHEGLIPEEAEIKIFLKDSRKLHTPVEQAELIRRRLERDLNQGISRKESKKQFLAQTGMYSQKYEDLLEVTKLPKHILDLIQKGVLSLNAVASVTRNAQITHDKKIQILEAGLESLLYTDKKKVPANLISEITNDYLKRQKEELIQAVENTNELTEKNTLTNSEKSEDNVKENKLLNPPKEAQNTSENNSNQEHENSQEKIKLTNNHSYISTNSAETEKNSIEVRPKIKLPKATSKEKAQILEKIFAEAIPIKDENSDHLLIKIPEVIWKEAEEIFNRGS